MTHIAMCVPEEDIAYVYNISDREYDQDRWKRRQSRVEAVVGWLAHAAAPPFPEVQPAVLAGAARVVSSEAPAVSVAGQLENHPARPAAQVTVTAKVLARTWGQMMERALKRTHYLLLLERLAMS
jgi:hypothetical protein